MDKLPYILTINDQDYILEETQFSKHASLLPGWWSFMYRPLDRQFVLPPNVHDDHDWYYLCTVAENKEDAYKDMVERVNRMILD